MLGVRQLPAAQGCSRPAEMALTRFRGTRCESLSRLDACGSAPSVQPERENAPSREAAAPGAQGSEEPACASASAGTVPLCAPPRARLLGARQCVRMSGELPGPVPGVAPWPPATKEPGRASSASAGQSASPLPASRLAPVL